MLFIDIHTHKRKLQGALEIVNLDLDRYINNISINNNIYSVGIHPWRIDENAYKIYSDRLYSTANSFNIIFIGETGLDKFSETSFAIQEEVFRMHAKVSEELRKPLVIHCVRYFNEIIRLKNELKPEMPWIIHGFNNNIEIATQLIAHSIFISFGKALFVENSNAGQVLEKIPSDSFFLETDDGDINIQEVYEKAANILSLDINTLCTIQQKNFERILEKTNYKLCIQGQNYSLEKKD